MIRFGRARFVPKVTAKAAPQPVSRALPAIGQTHA